MAKEKEVLVAIMNRGSGPVVCSTGKMLPGQSLEVPASEATRLCGYKHVCLAKDVVASLGEVEALRKSNAALLAKVASLEVAAKETPMESPVAPEPAPEKKSKKAPKE